MWVPFLTKSPKRKDCHKSDTREMGKQVKNSTGQEDEELSPHPHMKNALKDSSVGKAAFTEQKRKIPCGKTKMVEITLARPPRTQSRVLGQRKHGRPRRLTPHRRMELRRNGREDLRTHSSIQGQSAL